MARTTTRQKPKPRNDDLDKFGRRDGSVSQRNAVYHDKKDPYWIPFATRVYRDAGWDTALIDEGLDQPLFDEEEIDSDEWDNLFANWDADLKEVFPEDLQPVDDHDPVWGDRHIHTEDIDDQGSYGSYRGVYFLGQGFSLDAVFGEGYRGGNCGFSVKSHP